MQAPTALIELNSNAFTNPTAIIGKSTGKNLKWAPNPPTATLESEGVSRKTNKRQRVAPEALGQDENHMSAARKVHQTSSCDAPKIRPNEKNS